MNVLSLSNLLTATDWYVGILMAMIALTILFAVISVVAVKPSKKQDKAEEKLLKQPEEEETLEEVAEETPSEEVKAEEVKEESETEVSEAVPVEEAVEEEVKEEAVEEEVPAEEVEEESVSADKKVIENEDEATEEVPTVESVLGETEKENADEAESVLEPAPAITMEQILLEAEEESEDDEVETEILPEEDEPQEVVRSVDKRTGLAIIVRYKKSFTAKLIQSDDKVKAYYSLLKNELLSYNKVKSRTSWNHENFNFGKSNIARFSIRGKSLCVYFALDPAAYADTKYKVEHAESKKYEGIPCMYRIKNARRVKLALDLIAALAEKYGIQKGKQQNENYYQPYETTKVLIDIGLIKELVSEEDYNKFMRRFSRKEVDRKRREFVSAKEVNEIISDDIALALVEDKRKPSTGGQAVKAKVSGSKKDIVNIDSLSANYENNEVVNLESLKEKGLIAKSVEHVKILARGTLSKSLIVEAQDFSIEAIKMIVLTGGKATKV